MQNKKFSAAAIALVTAGAAASARGAVMNVVDGSFEQSATTYPSAYGYNFAFVGWNHTTVNVAWVSQSNTGIANGDGSTFGVLEGTNTPSSALFQQVGTYDPNTSVRVSFLLADKRNFQGSTMTVSLLSGGTVIDSPSALSSYGSQYDVQSLSGATLLGSTTLNSFDDSLPEAFIPQILTFGTGVSGTSGDPLYVMFQDNATQGPQVAIDGVSVSSVPEPTYLSVAATAGIAVLRRRRSRAKTQMKAQADGV